MEHDSSQRISGYGYFFALGILVFEDLLNLEPSLLDLDVSNHDVSILQVLSQLVTVKFLDCFLEVLIKLLFKDSSDFFVIWLALVVYIFVLICFSGELKAVELVFDVLLNVTEILESLLIEIDKSHLAERGSEGDNFPVSQNSTVFNGTLHS